MSRVNNKEKYKEYDHKYYIKNKRPKTKIGQAELKIEELEAKLADKEKEIEKIKLERAEINERSIIRKWGIDDLKQQLTEKEKEFEWLHQKFAKGTNAKAIEELEKVRKYVDGRTYLAQYIDERVNQLKEGK